MAVELVTYRTPESFHFYTKDGEPQHDADLRAARKLGLFPSVTTILGVKAKPQLNDWIAKGLAMQAVTMPRDKGESDDDWWKRVKDADAEERAKAPDFGTMIHEALAEYLQSDKRSDLPHVQPVFAWLYQHVQATEVEARFCYPHLGYGGCIDLKCKVDGREALVDWKTQGVKRDSPAYYDEWCSQLIAYAAGDMDVDLYSVVIDTTTPGKWHEPKLWTRDEKEWGWKEFIALRDAWFASKRYDPRERAF